MRRSGTRTRQVALALPASAVITKKIALPAGLTPSALEAQVEAEASQYIPFSLDEVSLDFCLMGPSADSQTEVDVLIAASRKEKVQDRQGLAEAAGLRPVILDIESCASRLAVSRLIDSLPCEGPQPMVALFEVNTRPNASSRCSMAARWCTTATRPLAAPSSRSRLPAPMATRLTKPSAASAEAICPKTLALP